ncbi:MAG: hypothetical protein M3Z08_03585 [Chloroflexota bacterium]|nr:hypothetical protein [Chloroflexota bacterium]
MQLSQQELREDVLQLAQLLVESHPDPYSAGGGPLAFHRKVAEILEALPEEGLTAQQLLRRVRPLVASLQDGHTSIHAPETSSAPQVRPWLTWEPAEERLVLTGVYRPEDRSLLGARLVRLEGVPFAELVQRVSQVRGCDNVYQQLVHLAMAFSDPGLEGHISFKRSLSFPHDPERGKLLRPTYELTYEYLASRNFDPHATVSLAFKYRAG